MSSSADLLPLSEVAQGPRFAAFVLSKFGRSVSLVSPENGAFSMLAAFGRCRFCLEESSVAQSLSAILGGPAESFNVCLVEERIFLFSVSCKEVGFEIYKLRTFKCADFELFFHLFNDSGLSFARSHTSCSPVFPWEEVGKKPSYDETVQNVRLTGANSVPVSSKSVGTSSRSSCKQLQGSSPLRKSVFDHIQFPRRSVFDRLSQIPNSANVQNTMNVVHAVRRKISPKSPGCSVLQSAHASIQRHSPEGNLNLDLNLGPSINVSGNSNALASSSIVLCRRCHSSSHSRRECRAPIKCDKCLGWGHVAVSCHENWKSLQSCVNTEKV